MSTIDTHTKSKTFEAALANVIEDARRRGTPPTTAADAIKGMDQIAALYHSRPATEQTAKEAFDLATTLFYDFPNFAEALSTAEKQQQQ